MSKKHNPLKSVRVKLFMTLSLVILLIIIFLYKRIGILYFF